MSGAEIDPTKPPDLEVVPIATRRRFSAPGEIGALLRREGICSSYLNRLATLHDYLDLDQAATLARAQRELELQKSQWRSRYQNKLARELRSRLDAWAWYLDDCKKEGESAIVHYPRQVETRVKVDLLLDEAGAVGVDVEESRQRQVALDKRLGAFFTVGEFCWLEQLAPGFPPDRFWYLWGQPTNDRPL